MSMSSTQLADVLAELQSSRKVIVFTNGCFDILHVGHAAYLQQAKELGDVLVVGVNSDASVRRLKGYERPVNTEADRAALLEALKPVDYTCIFDEDTPERLIKELNPDVLAKGGDYSVDTIVGADFLLAKGGRVVVLPYVDGKSSTAVINRMKALR